MLVMALRALTLVVVLGLPPAVGAVEGLFHLCHGRVQFDLTCCCDHSQAAQRLPDACVSSEHGTCCGELKAQLAPEPPATATSGGVWAPLPVVVAQQVAPTVPPAPELLPTLWVRTRGVHRATAPPLYLQNCSYLI